LDIIITLNDGSADHDLSDYLPEGGLQSLAVRVESDKPAEPGIIAFDGLDLEFAEDDLDDLFSVSTLATVRAAEGRYTVTVQLSWGTPLTVFLGFVDFDSVEYTDAGTVRFSCIDFLQALKFVPREDVRDLTTFDTGAYRHSVHYYEAGKTIYLKFWAIDEGLGDYAWMNWPNDYFDFDNGAVWEIYDRQFLILNSEIASYTDIYGTRDCLKLTLQNDFPDLGPQVMFAGLTYYSKNMYGEDCYDYGGATPTSFDGWELLEIILEKAMPGLVIDATDCSASSLPIDLDMFDNTGIGDFRKDLFGEHPADFVRRMAAAMRAYMYFGSDGVLYFIDKPTTASYIADLTLETTSDAPGLIHWRKRFSWLKRVDCVHVTCKYLDSDDEAYYPDWLSETAEETMSVDVVQLTGDTLAELAEDLWEFYGQRHLAATVTVALTEDVAAALFMMATVRLDSVDYFLYEYQINPDDETVELQLASFQRWAS